MSAQPKPVQKGRSGRTIPAEYFRDLYRRVDDPWEFTSSTYEHEKYAATLRALARARYRSALELACSIGVFTEMLAPRCDALLAVDVSEDALAQAALRCARIPSVRFAVCDVSAAFPAGRFDLITVCEVAFYLGARDLARLRDDIAAALVPGGECMLVHWTPLVEGHAQTADDVHDSFLADPRFAHAIGARAATYRLDRFTRA